MIIGIMLMGMGKALGQSLALARMEVVDRAGHFLLFFLLKKRYLYKKKNLFWGAKNGIPKYRY